MFTERTAQYDFSLYGVATALLELVVVPCIPGRDLYSYGSTRTDTEIGETESQD